MAETTTWRRMITDALSAHNLTWQDVVDFELPFEGALDTPFLRDHGGSGGPGPIRAWTADLVFNSDDYDGCPVLIEARRHPPAELPLDALLGLSPPHRDPAIGLPKAVFDLARDINAWLDQEKPLPEGRAPDLQKALIRLEQFWDDADTDAADRIDRPKRARDGAAQLQRALTRLRQRMEQQDLLKMDPRRIARGMTKIQRRTLAHAAVQSSLMGDDMDCATRTALALCDRGLLRTMRGIYPTYAITALGREVALALDATGARTS